MLAKTENLAAVVEDWLSQFEMALGADRTAARSRACFTPTAIGAMRWR